jgi:hypothetical protein
MPLRKAAKMAHKYEPGTNKLVSPHQHTVIEHEKMKPETVIIPNDGTTNFGSYFTISFKEKGLKLIGMQLQWNVSAISGITVSGGSTTYPNFNPAWFFFTRIEVLLGTNIIDTIFPNQQFLMNQLFKPDESRALANFAAGNYSTSTASVTTRCTMASTTYNYYTDIFSLFNQNNIPLLFGHTEIQLKIYTDTVANIVQVGTGTGTASATLNYCNLLAKVVRLKDGIPKTLTDEHLKTPHHYKFTDLKTYTTTILSGTTSTNIILSGIKGKVAFLMFTMRISTPTGANAYEYQPLYSFSILDSTSTNISGGQVVLSPYSLLVLNKDLTLSTYTAETSYGSQNNYANVYIYSFSHDMIDAIDNGRNNGYHLFQANEQLQINFSSAITSNYQIDIYGFTHSVLQISGASAVKMDD